MDRKDLDVTLYLVTDSSYHTEESLLRTVEEACKGGVTLVQLREKNKGGREYLDKAFKVKEITDRYNVPLIIDDRVDVALACDAAGVHVGASDIPVAVARKLMGPDKIVGATAKTVEAAVKAYEDGADYLGVGAIYPTTTKVVTILTKVSTLKDICEAVPKMCIRDRIRRAQELANLTEADGGILFAHWGCKGTIGASSLIKNSLENAGLPTMVLDGDGCNPANSSDGQVSTRLQAYLEMLSEGKEEKRS